MESKQISLYLDILKKSLIDYYNFDRVELKPLKELNSFENKVARKIDAFLRKRNHCISRPLKGDTSKRLVGREYSPNAYTMIGLERLNNLEYCALDVIKNNVKGDFIEAGVWRGGATIFMNGILEITNSTDRKVWVADSFEGVPKPNVEKYPQDKGDLHYLRTDLAVSKEDVESNFKKFNLLNENVKFLKGWFKDTLPNPQIKKLSIIRADGDIFESTMDILNNLYPKLSIGGYLIIDDYGAINNCREAINFFRDQNNITEEIKSIDWTGVYWQKQK